MATLDDLGVTPNKLRSYGHDGKFEALTPKQLQGVCCWAKAQLDKKQGKFKRWSKKTAEQMRGIGVQQCQSTGEPTITYRKQKVIANISVSLEDYNALQDELTKAEETILKLRESKIDPSYTIGVDLASDNDESVTAEVEDGEVKKVKRKRRTKAQIEADKLTYEKDGVMHVAEGEVDPRGVFSEADKAK